ncbi:MAG: HPr family phosphocarrier protein [Lachnospiraceae bacterium]|jgi:catabolite repression HPr-like protein|nr:HPr family phosphocarrier protein [Lachnospiraceae bacterium]MBO4558522.1 HPr family phosphocarrier protein [Lachnospiraceae bacterium]MBO7352854.1 HPr family phosphocarrier protein [Lachnospiraceae bacterium]MBO7632837.1 HPr family phosphocarrier protein [Lachnospiraceae bacterium]MBP5651798.1 HPr family phosphocarrier protein [Lachnospiraceae bacterium]
MVQKKMAIDITADLDRRPIAKLVQEASKFESTVYFEYKDKKVNAKSIMGMMTFISIMNRATAANDLIDVIVNGSDEEEAMKSIEAFFA